jgi:hypothetical protein
MGFAYAGKPYMAVGRNLAYRKSTFFRNRGFAGNLHIPSGEDDLPVNALGNGNNTVIEPSLSAKTLSLPKTSWKEYFSQKRKRVNSMALYTSESKLRLFIEPIFRILFYVAFILSLVFSPPFSPIFWIVISLFVVRFIIQYAVINSTAHTLGERRFHLSIIICDILMPIITVVFMIIGKIFRKTRKFYW